MPVKINRDRLQNLLTDLVDIYSPSGKEEEIIEYLRNYLELSGIVVQKQVVSEDRYNLILLSGKEPPPVVMVGHVDTVPAFDYDNYRSDLDENILYGLGSADMKGGCAAMVEAFLSFRQSYPDHDFPAALALVVGEEETGDGAIALCRDFRFNWAVIGEPTDLKACFAHFSYVEIALTTRGKRSHASVSRPGQNAVKNMLDLLNILIEHVEQHKSDILYNVRDMQSSQAGFAAPDFCTAYLDLHMPTQYSIGELTAELEEMVESRMEGDRKQFSLSTIHNGYRLPLRGEMARVIESAFHNAELDFNADTFRSDSDAPLLWQSGIKPVVLGPGHLSVAHTNEESISVPQVIDAARLYLGLLEELAGVNA
ncbi:MAG TPA: M20/M25/M40 family metallo-hydrolase [Desulfobacteraceae bacterium]|nr:M20/M25/M40 family metallo-hydrolase [Desulfobacteraceae bacterium]HPJ66473.1 M20/M25/M40 family metallo-hydrolase [Desulfobacteraceae bacterium]HPQ28000.1 M20/M25/M40 family metallo-hydrolase [Desulfobacteraceae bacterium]